MILGAGLLFRLSGFPLGRLAAVFSLAFLYAVVYLSVTVAFSTLTASPLRAIIGILVYQLVVTLPYALSVFHFHTLADTSDSFVQLVLAVTGGINPSALYAVSTRLVLAEQQSDLWYLQGEIAAVGLICWIIVPFVFTLWRFDRIDI